MPQISEAVLKVLDAGQYDGSKFVLVGQLDRKLYTDTNKVLEAAGGKWNRSAKAHVFDGAAIDALEPIILTGAYSRTKQDFGQFDTPEDLAAEVVAIAGIEPRMNVLEPSAGVGNLVDAIVSAGGIVHAFEIDDKRRAVLQASGLMRFPVASGDFLTFEASPTFERVVMNPPFAAQADIRHVMHAFKFLKSGGKLVSIMSSGVMFRDNKLTADFRDFVYAHDGSIERLPEDSFKASGTAVNTCVVTMHA
jgi:predicted RNA methylase